MTTLDDSLCLAAKSEAEETMISPTQSLHSSDVWNDEIFYSTECFSAEEQQNESDTASETDNGNEFDNCDDSVVGENIKDGNKDGEELVVSECYGQAKVIFSSGNTYNDAVTDSSEPTRQQQQQHQVSDRDNEFRESDEEEGKFGVCQTNITNSDDDDCDGDCDTVPELPPANDLSTSAAIPEQETSPSQNSIENNCLSVDDGSPDNNVIVDESCRSPRSDALDVSLRCDSLSSSKRPMPAESVVDEALESAESDESDESGLLEPPFVPEYDEEPDETDTESVPHLRAQFIENMWASLVSIPTIRLSILGKHIEDLARELDIEEGSERNFMATRRRVQQQQQQQQNNNDENNNTAFVQVGQVVSIDDTTAHGNNYNNNGEEDQQQRQQSSQPPLHVAVAEPILSEFVNPVSNVPLNSEELYRRLGRKRAEFVSAAVVKKENAEIGLELEKVISGDVESADNTSNVESEDSFLRITSISPDGLFAKSPFCVGDKVHSINHKLCTKQMDADAALSLMKETEVGDSYLVIVTHNKGGSSDLFESMIEKPSPGSLVGLGLRSDAQDGLWMSRIDTGKIVTHSLFNVGDKVLAINNQVVEETRLHSSVAAQTIKNTPRYVSLVTSTSGGNAIVLAAERSESSRYRDFPALENGIVGSIPSVVTQHVAAATPLIDELVPQASNVRFHRSSRRDRMKRTFVFIGFTSLIFLLILRLFGPK